METRSKTRLKRQHESEESKQHKTQRLEKLDESDGVSTAIEITDVNDFCLIKIFEHLDIQSLLNVANSNKWLQPAAVAVYQRKFDKVPVEIDDFRRDRINGMMEVDGGHGKIRIFGLKATLQYLRCFGQSISDLTIDYSHSMSKRHTHVHKYVSDYCASSLNRIKFYRMPNTAIDQFQKVFANVHDLSIGFGCYLGQQLPTFAKCFPNVRRFEAKSSTMIDRFVKKPFPYLEHLSFCYLRCDEFTTHEIVADVLNKTDQLKCLEVTSVNCVNPKMPISALLDLIKDNPSITRLIWSAYCDELVDLDKIQRIVAEHSALVELDLKNCEFRADNAIALIRHLKSLKMFRFRMSRTKYTYLKTQVNDEWLATCDGIRHNKMTIITTLNRKVQ